jgi:ABC-type proline/glycine betaine transport system substrate-binding protein
MKLLDFSVTHDPAEWNACTSVRGCANPRMNAYPVSQAFTLMTRSFADRAGPVMTCLKARSWDNETISQGWHGRMKTVRTTKVRPSISCRIMRNSGADGFRSM